MNSVVLKFETKKIFIDLEINRKGLYFHVKDSSTNDYILLDLSGLEDFLILLNQFVEKNTEHFLKTDSLFLETKAMRDNKRVFFFLFKFNKFFVNKNIIQSFFLISDVHIYYTRGGRKMPKDLDR